MGFMSLVSLMSLMANEFNKFVLMDARAGKHALRRRVCHSLNLLNSLNSLNLLCSERNTFAFDVFVHKHGSTEIELLTAFSGEVVTRAVLAESGLHISVALEVVA